VDQELLLALIGIPVVVLAMVVGSFFIVRAAVRRWTGTAKAAAGLQVWAARHGWEITHDGRVAAEWATRFHFSADDLTGPYADIAARGWVHGRDAMVLFYQLRTGDSPKPITIAAVDVHADYPVTAVARPKSAGALSHPYGSTVPLESVEFGRRWSAMGRDAAGSHAIFTPRVIERLLEPMPGGQPEIVWDGPGIRTVDDSFIGDPMRLESRLLLLAELASLTPGYQVTHANDDPSLLRYARPPTFYITGAALVLQVLGALVWVVGLMMVAPALHEIWAVAVSVVVGLALFLPGVRLERREKARRVREWHAAHAAALAAPPPTERRTPGP
jgi:hypothetical protein